MPDIDNKSLGLSRQRSVRKAQNISPDIWTEISQPIARIIMGLQTQFGLTFSEAIQLIDGVHVKEDMLWITRDIAFNSEDRTIPVCTKNQQSLFLS